MNKATTDRLKRQQDADFDFIRASCNDTDSFPPTTKMQADRDAARDSESKA